MTHPLLSRPRPSTKSNIGIHIGHERRLHRQSKRKLGVGLIENDGDTQMIGSDEFGSYWTTLLNRIRRTSGSPGDHASPRFPPEPPFSDCGMRVKEPALISFVRPRRRLFFRPDRVSTSPSRADAVKAGRSSAATEGLALAASSTMACSSVRADKQLLRRHQVPAGSPFSPWSGIAPSTPWHSTFARPNVARALTISTDGMQAAPRASCCLVPAGTRTRSGSRFLDQSNLMPRKRLQPASQSGTFLLKATCDA
jgi:hypothetical protein